MADVRPLHALRYDLGVVGALDDVIAPPYDVLDDDDRAALLARSPYNVVDVDLPRGEPDPYAAAAATLARWEAEGALVREDTGTMWVLEQPFTGPDGRSRVRRGLLARVRVEDYGPGRIRPHERTHPGPKEDRLRLTRATRANLSPIFALHAGDAIAALGPLGEPWGEADGVRLWRVEHPERLDAAGAVLRDAELLIADGHHRYETARVYAEEVGGEGAHRYVLMCLVSLEDPGLVIFPTHRLVTLDDAQRARLDAVLREHFSLEEVAPEIAAPVGDGGPGKPFELGFVDGASRRAFRCTLRDQSIADAALAAMPEPYRTLDTAILEALVLQQALGLTEDDVSHLRGLGYSRSDDEALALVLDGPFDAGFLLRATPVRQVQDIAAAGVNMPPKSTFFFPKVPTGLVLNPLT